MVKDHSREIKKIYCQLYTLFNIINIKWEI